MTTSTRYTRERLAEAAARCADVDEVMAFFGTPPYDKLRRYLLKRFAHYGTDIAHFLHRRRGGPASRPEPEELRGAVEGAISIAGALRALGRADSGQTRALFRQWTAEDGIATSHFLGQAHQRGKPGAVKAAAEVLVHHDGRRRTRTHLLRRALLDVGVDEECAECGVGPEWLGKPMTLEIDHINGDWSDDRRENLRLLCPNCHAMTDTWCRGGGRVK